MPSLNNEIDIITVGGVDQDIRDTHTRNSIAPTEPLGVASMPHKVNEVFYSAADRLMYRATAPIAIGDTFTPGEGGNVELKTLSELMYLLFAQSPELVMRSIADYEPTNIASKTYHSGDKVYLSDGNLYKVTTKTYAEAPLINGSNVAPADSITASINYLEKKKENKKVVLEQRLAGGDTTLQFTNNAIDNTKILRPATDVFGKMPLSMTLDGNTVTMVFKAQSAAMTVYLIIEEAG